MFYYIDYISKYNTNITGRIFFFHLKIQNAKFNRIIHIFITIYLFLDKLIQRTLEFSFRCTINCYDRKYYEPYILK